MKITVLTDDKVKKRGFLAEHGLSLYIEHESGNYLFDTGQSDVFLRNAKHLRLDLNKTDYIVLSHGHYDHCGGAAYLPKLEKSPKIYVQEPALKPKFAINKDNATYREIGIPWSAQVYDRLKPELVTIKGTVKINPYATLIGGVPVSDGSDEKPKGFYTKSGNIMADDMMADEQLLVFDDENGLTVFLGCSHPGIINCLHYAEAQFPDRKIDTVVAGMHLDNADPLRLQSTIRELSDLNARKICPLHCTGINAIAEIKKNFGNKCEVLYAGDTVEF